MERLSFLGRKLALSLGLIFVSAAYVAWQHLTGSQTPVVPPPTAGVQTAPLETAPITVLPAPQPVPVSAPKPVGLYADGAYTGPAVDVFYGLVQVKAVISGGKIVDVLFLQHPSERSTSIAINEQAMPLLTQEAIQAQSAKVDGVSGATATSEGFVQSLTAALALAKN